jgi:adenylate cyclase
MAAQEVARKLAAILAADVVAYSRLAGADEERTLARLRALRSDLIDPIVSVHHGRIVKRTGDGALVEFRSVVDAVRCAIEVQNGMVERNAGLPQERRIEFRIGIHLGDVIEEHDRDLMGDGVNIVARLEGFAEPGGICLSDDAYRQVRDRVTEVFTDLGDQSLKNIARPIRVYRIDLNPSLATARQKTVAPALALPDKPSIAVLPFQNMSGDPEQEFFADGVVEEIITALSRIRWLFVIARNSTFTYKGQTIDVKQVGRELGVRYVLEGSVRRGGGRVRITAQLIEAETGAHLWADRFDGSLEDVFDLQDQVATQVAGVIEPELQLAEIARSSRRPTTDLTARDLYLRATALVFSRARQIPEAMQLLDQALARDPSYGPALAWCGLCYFLRCLDGCYTDWEAEAAKGIDYARRALRTGEDDPATLVNSAITLGYYGEDIEAMIALADRALTSNPSFARGWHVSAVLRLWAGQAKRAVEDEKACLRLSPRVRIGWAQHLFGGAHLLEGRFDEAVPHLRLAIEEEPNFLEPYRLLAASYAHLGRLDSARDVVKRLRASTSHVIPVHVPYRRTEHRDIYLSGLTLASEKAT